MRLVSLVACRACFGEAKRKTVASTSATKAAQGSQEWRRHHQQVRDQTKCPAKSANAWTKVHAKQLKPLGLTERCLDLIDLAHDVVTAKHREDADVSGLYLDLSQSGGHRPWTCEQLRSVTTSSHYFSYSLCRPIEPQELFGVLGFLKPQFGTLSFSCLKSMLGECMSLPCVGLIVYGLCVAGFPDKWAGTRR